MLRDKFGKQHKGTFMQRPAVRGARRAVEAPRCEDLMGFRQRGRLRNGIFGTGLSETCFRGREVISWLTTLAGFYI